MSLLWYLFLAWTKVIDFWSWSITAFVILVFIFWDLPRVLHRMNSEKGSDS